VTSGFHETERLSQEPGETRGQPDDRTHGSAGARGQTVSGEPHPIREFLLRRGASRLQHPGGTLYEHVSRVAELLAEWGAGQELQAAGLCHACYGTDGYAPVLLSLADRPGLSELIGARAESLVYLYASCDRAAVYPALRGVGPVPFRDRFTGTTRTPPERDIRAFLELTAANELDVIRHSPAMAAEHGPALLWLFAAARQRLSAAAWQAWSRQPAHQPEPAQHEPAPHSPTAEPVSITGLDHLVLTVSDIDRTIGFYQRVLGMRPVTFGGGRHAVAFGASKINLHRAGQEIAPHAARPAPGSADVCLITAAPPQQVLAHLGAHGVSAELGPVPRTGARGPITSIYLRDPDRNLIEIASYPADMPAIKAGQA
jgi:catechol 2,3-dioxygenase-like lactoylglutathione lyase family enzyme